MAPTSMVQERWRVKLQGRHGRCKLQNPVLHLFRRFYSKIYLLSTMHSDIDGRTSLWCQ